MLWCCPQFAVSKHRLSAFQGIGAAPDLQAVPIHLPGKLCCPVKTSALLPVAGHIHPALCALQPCPTTDPAFPPADVVPCGAATPAQQEEAAEAVAHPGCIRLCGHCQRCQRTPAPSEGGAAPARSPQGLWLCIQPQGQVSSAFLQAGILAGGVASLPASRAAELTATQQRPDGAVNKCLQCVCL